MTKQAPSPTPFRSLEPFKYLLGQWSLTRDIPGHATAVGSATVTLLAPGSARYEERVTLHLPGNIRLPGSTTYLLLQRSPSSLDVLFPHTGTLFEHLDFCLNAGSDLTAHATHRCAPDRYDSVWQLLPPGEVTMTHRVHGPRKNYTAHTVLSR